MQTSFEHGQAPPRGLLWAGRASTCGAVPFRLWLGRGAADQPVLLELQMATEKSKRRHAPLHQRRCSIEPRMSAGSVSRVA